MSALLGASPGASVAVSAMLTLLKRCFPAELASQEWQARLGQIFKADAQQLAADAALYQSVQAHSNDVLGLA